MKRFLFPLCALAACTGISYAAVGDTFSEGSLTFEVIADGEVAVTDYDNAVTEFVIPGTVSNNGETYTVTTVGEGAFYWSDMTSVSFPNSLTTIERQGFYNCESLAEVNFGTGLKTIGDYAFGYAAFESLELPEGVEKIGNSCFFCAANMRTIKFPSTLKEIGASCFYKVPLTEVSLPDGLEVLGEKAFLSCSSLASVTLPAGITAILDGTFYGTALTSIELPSSLVSIGEEAFYDVPLSEIVLPASLESIGGAAFSGTNLTKYVVADGNTHFTVVDDVLYNADKTLLVSFPAKCPTTELTLPDECVGISNAAFDKTGIQKVTVGSNFRAFDGYAFCNSELSEINFPESCVYIGEQAFAGTNITEVVLPKNLPMLYEAVFAECKSLTSVTLPAKMTYIGLRQFYNCTSLATVNCEGMTPPELETWWEAYESPFYGVPDEVVCNIPVGALQAYEDSDWNDVFSGRFVESLTGAILPTGISPADGESVSSFDGLTLQFSGKVAIADSNPDVKVIVGSLVAGVPVGDEVSVDSWMMVSDSDTEIRVFPADYDSYTWPFNMEAGKDYYIVIPAGVIEDVNGLTNEEILVHYKGAYEAPVVQLESVSPEDGSSITAIGTISFTFAESVALVESKLSDIRVVKGSLIDGVPTGDDIAVERWWPVGGTTSGTAISIFAGDEYDGFAMDINLDPDADYYVVLPAGLFRLSSSYSTVSDEIILHYSNGLSGVSVAAADGIDEDSQVEIYTVDGRRVATMEAGRIYIVRKGSSVTKVIGK